MKNLSWLVMFVAAPILAANIYMHENTNGGVVYSDMPMGDSKVINIENDGSVSSSSDVTSPSGSIPTENKNNTSNSDQNVSAVGAEEDDRYTYFGIVSPANQETVQSQPSFPVTFRVEPALRKNDAIMLYVDGQAKGAPSQNLVIQVSGVDRGTHTISGRLMNARQKALMETPTITIYVRQTSNITSPAFRSEQTVKNPNQEKLLGLLSRLLG